MVAVRLLIGVLKGLILGALVGFGLVAAGIGFDSPFIAYPIATAVGVLVALVAGKPIWAKDARIEVGMKAAAGALLAPGLLWLVRRFLEFNIPFTVNTLPGLESAPATPVVGMFAVTALGLVAAVLAGFYDADNQPEPESDKQEKTAAKPARAPTVKLAAGSAPAEEAELDDEDEPAVREENRK